MSLFLGYVSRFLYVHKQGLKIINKIKMKKKITLLLIFVTSLTYSQVIVSKKLSEPSNKIVQKLSKRSQIWISGEWVEKGKNYVWKKGYWTNKKPGYVFEQGNWEKFNDGWIWKAGNWRKIDLEKWHTVYS